MLYAFQPLLCLKLCWHNRLKPNTDTMHAASYRYILNADDKPARSGNSHISLLEMYSDDIMNA